MPFDEETREQLDRVRTAFKRGATFGAHDDRSRHSRSANAIDSVLVELDRRGEHIKELEVALHTWATEYSLVDCKACAALGAAAKIFKDDS